MSQLLLQTPLSDRHLKRSSVPATQMGLQAPVFKPEEIIGDG